MRVFISTLGSDGDILPFTRLGPALVARGHAVTVHTWRQYRRWFSPGVEVVDAALDVGAEELHRAYVDALAMASPWDQIHRFAQLFYGLDSDDGPARASFERCAAAMVGHDFAICDVLDHLGQAAAEAAGVPWLSWASRPPPVGVDAPLARTDAALSALVSRVTGRASAVQTFRARSRWLDLAACSPILAPPGPPDPKLVLTGAWFGPPAGAPAVLPTEVDAFLDGRPTLLVSFGTLPDARGRTGASSSTSCATRPGRVGADDALHRRPPRGLVAAGAAARRRARRGDRGDVARGGGAGGGA